MEKELTQDELFARDGFTMTAVMEHPESKAKMKFTQWEARYVQHLDFEVYRLKNYIKQLEHAIALHATNEAREREIIEKLKPSK